MITESCSCCSGKSRQVVYRDIDRVNGEILRVRVNATARFEKWKSTLTKTLFDGCDLLPE